MFDRRVNRRNLAIKCMAVMLLATSFISLITMSDSTFAFAMNVRDINQEASISNSCLNPTSDSNTYSNMISNGNCGGTISQEAKSGQASTPTTIQNANPTIEVQRSTTTAQPPLTSTRGSCTSCFDTLNATQKSDFESILQFRSMESFGVQINTIEQFCTHLENIVSNGDNPEIAVSIVQGFLQDIPGVSADTSQNIANCINRAVL
jgi:hypothetical protein